MNTIELRKLYGRLRAIKDVTSIQHYFEKGLGDDYNSIVNRVSKIIEEDLADFLLPKDFYWKGGDDKLYCSSDTIRTKLLQLLNYLDYGYNLSESIIEIGSLYNSIIDEELKGRCADILSAPSKFDRVINQATLVLEDRIRKKSNINEPLIGIQLVNKVLNPDLSKTVLKISDNQEEHEGVCHICRGIMLAFRNPTHHYITDSYRREDALKFCAFVDNLLQLIDRAKLAQSE